MDGADVSSSFCDRRLSRAAREILRQRLKHAVKTLGLSSLSHNSLSDSTPPPSLWSWLESQQPSLLKGASNTACPIQPHRDVLREEEEHVQRIPARFDDGRRGSLHTIPSNRYTYRQNPYWYQCLFCQKIFSSRYYLDQHMMLNHHHHNVATLENEDGELSDSPMLCPASDWCSFLSVQACHEMALELEPYYDRGSEGRRAADRVTVEHKLWKQAHQLPCTKESMYQARSACHDMIDHCFIHTTTGNDADDDHDTGSRRVGMLLNQTICERISCPDRLHRVFFQSAAGSGGHLVMRHVHEWHEDWVYWSSHHQQLTWVSAVFVLALCAWYSRTMWQVLVGTRRRKATAGTRLLRSAPAKSKKGWFRSWSTEKKQKKS